MPPPRPTPPAPSARRRPGFSLVLSLIITSLLLLVIITLTSFLKIESQLAGQALHRTQARLQALVSLRLALAHLQQEAGPDRRMTARADITADTMQKGWDWQSIRNPLWTGVWRSDNAAQPPAWLVSGRHDQPAGTQSVSLAGVETYDPGRHLPWDSSYAPEALRLIPLIGDASASPAVLATTLTWGKPDGRVTLPRVTLPDKGTTGTYAYWIGDEGVKARLNLADSRVSPPGASITDATRQAALRGASRAGVELLPGLQSMPEDGLDKRVRSHAELDILSLSPGSGVVETSPPSVVKRLQTEATLWSRGVNCDTRLGGLKVDLSLAFEMTDVAWQASEFASGGAATDSQGNALAGATYFLGADANTPVYTFDKVNVPYDATDHKLSTLYRIDWGYASFKSRGPTWDALRNYYLLYKELDWSAPTNPTLRARAHFPNTLSLAASGYGGTAHYSHRYNRMDSAENFTVLDVFNGKEAPRPVKVAVTPYVARQLLVWGLMEQDGELRLTLSPITVLHNPYNVAVRLQNDAQEAAAMRLSFRYWDKWRVNFSTSSKGAWQRYVIDLARAVDSSTNAAESFRTYIKEGTVLQPGEFQVFSSASPSPLAFTRLPPVSANSFDFLGGFYLPWVDAKGARVKRLPTDSISAQILSTGPFYVRHLLTCWKDDRIMAAGNANDGELYNICSEVTELLANDLDRSGTVPAKVFPAGYTLPGAGSPPKILAVFDYGVRWARDPQPFPVFSHSNPMATMTRPEATGIGPTGMPTGFAKTSSSFKLTVRDIASWPEVIEVAGAGNRAYGGASVTAARGGVTKAVYTEVPLNPPVSLAQFAHANFTLRDQEPLLAIGNSISSLYSPYNYAGLSLTNETGRDLITWDQTWWGNAALFDRYFLSGATPEGTRGPKFTVKRSLDTILDDFVAGTGRLANPRTTLSSNRDPATVRAMVGDHRRIAGATLTEGAFNVNSTSVEAWAALLASSKRLAMGALTASQPATDQNTRYPRAIRADKPGYNAASPYANEEAWTGLATFSDDQIKRLAKAIVDEIRSRVSLAHRDFSIIVGGTDANQHRMAIAMPFRSLSEFVNRFTCGYHPEASVAGCLQTAIVRADTDGANLSNRTPPDPALLSSPALLQENFAPGSVPWTPPPSLGRESLSLYDPRTPDTERGHLHVGSPAALTQADLLAVIGPALATRSDTFVIRCYGDVTTHPGSVTTKAAAWIEAVVQRTPEFCDASQPPETEVSDLADSEKPNPRLKMVNRLLGRRFQVVSFRYLSPKEL